MRLLTIIKNRKDKEYSNQELKLVINAILANSLNKTDQEKKSILLGNLKTFAGENYNSRDFLGLR